MTRPTSVKIGHATYTIEWMDDRHWLQKHDADKVGLYLEGPRTISLRVEGDGQQYTENFLREILLHEILHGCWAHMNMDGGPKPDDLQEWVVGTMSLCLITVMQENPAVVKYLASGK